MQVFIHFVSQACFMRYMIFIIYIIYIYEIETHIHVHLKERLKCYCIKSVMQSIVESMQYPKDPYTLSIVIHGFIIQR